MSETTCALWYWRYGGLYYELCETEADAADTAVSIEDAGEGSVAGIQFSDGRVVERDDWAEYKAADERQWQRYKASEAARAKEPPRPTRQVLSPFGKEKVTVDADEPAWLGRPG